MAATGEGWVVTWRCGIGIGRSRSASPASSGGTKSARRTEAIAPSTRGSETPANTAAATSGCSVTPPVCARERLAALGALTCSLTSGRPAAGPSARRSYAGLPRGRDGSGVDVELVQRPVGVRTGAVRVVRPGGMSDAPVEGQADVVPVVDSVAGVVLVRRARADLQVRAEGRAAVGAECAPELGVVVRDAVGVSRPARTEIRPRIVPGDREVPRRRVSRDLGQGLTVRSVVVVDAHALAPRRPAAAGWSNRRVRVGSSGL